MAGKYLINDYSNEGDVSPNTRGAFCDNGDPCTDVQSTCGGYSENCHGYGPGVNEFDSCKIIGNNEFTKALELYESAATLLTGNLDYIHTFVDMENVTVDAQWTSTGNVETTCMAALGDRYFKVTLR
jgi:neutral ceramidase